MGKYRKVDVGLWNDEKFLGFTDEGKLAFVYLLTHPGMNALGAMRATIAGIAAELGWTERQLRKALTPAIAHGMVVASASPPFLRLTNFFRYNAPESQNAIRSWRPIADSLPECMEKTRLLKDARVAAEARDAESRKNPKANGRESGEGFLEVFDEVFPELLPECDAAVVARVAPGLPGGVVEGVPPGLRLPRRQGSATQEQEHLQEQEHQQDLLVEGSISKEASSNQPLRAAQRRAPAGSGVPAPRQRSEPTKASLPAPSWLTPYLDAWERGHGKIKPGHLASEIAPLHKDYGPERVLRVLAYYKRACGGPRYMKLSNFVNGFVAWEEEMQGGGPTSRNQTASEKTMAIAERRLADEGEVFDPEWIFRAAEEEPAITAEVEVVS